MTTPDQLGSEYQADSDFVMSYMLEGGSIAGRLVRLGPAVDEIVSKHDLPLSVGLLLSEYMVSAAAMASTLKFDGILTFQTKSSGPVSMMVTDVTTDGALRAMVSVDRERLATLGARPSAQALLGKGYLAITVDQGPDMDRYQGVVDIVGTNFIDTLHHYFKQSDQQDIVIKIATDYQNGVYRAGALTAQRVAFEGGLEIDEDEALENWRRSVILMSSATSGEILAPELQPAELLFRLFHEDGVQVMPPKALKAQCRCSAERVENVLRSLSDEERQHCLNDDKQIVSVCEFCRSNYIFELDDHGQPHRVDAE